MRIGMIGWVMTCFAAFAGGTLAAEGDFTPSFAKADGLIAAAIAHGEIPGAVLLVGRGDEIVYEKAYGHRASSRSVCPWRWTRCLTWRRSASRWDARRRSCCWPSAAS